MKTHFPPNAHCSFSDPPTMARTISGDLVRSSGWRLKDGEADDKNIKQNKLR